MTSPQHDPADRNEIAALLMRHSDSVYGYILACVRNRTDADDLLQNVAVAVIAAKTPPTADADFGRWAREIARRRILEYQRGKARLQIVDPLLLERLSEAANFVDQAGQEAARREALLQCVEQLPPRSRQLLIDRYAGASEDIEEIARRFGRTVQGVYSALYRVRQILRDCVDRKLAPEARP